ncbi:hypothetical protein Tco_1207891 [Tanacetum coccineum]
MARHTRPRLMRVTVWSKMPITSMLGRGWGSPTDWPGINPGNNGKDRSDQAKDASGTGSTKELRYVTAESRWSFEDGDRVSSGLTLERVQFMLTIKLQFEWKSPLKSWNEINELKAESDTVV